MKKVFIIILAVLLNTVFFPVLMNASYDKDESCILEARLNKIFELKKARYLSMLEIDTEKMKKVSEILESKHRRMLINIVKKRHVLQTISEMKAMDFEHEGLSKIINSLYDIEKEIIQVNQDQYNELIEIIDPRDALLYIQIERRFDRELRRRLREKDPHSQGARNRY